MRVKGFLRAFFTACTWRSFRLSKLHSSAWSAIERFSSGKRIWSTSDKRKKFIITRLKKLCPLNLMLLILLLCKQRGLIIRISLTYFINANTVSLS